MTLLILHYWPALVAAVLTGALFGRFSGRPAATERAGLWLALAALLVASASAVAAAGWLRGRAGLHLESGLLLFVAYMLGCALGRAAAGISARRSSREPSAAP